MKIFIAIFVVIFIAQVSSDAADCEKKAKDVANFLNDFKGTVDEAKTALKAKFAEMMKSDTKPPTPDEIKQFIDTVCSNLKPGGVFSCDDFKKFGLEMKP